MKIVLSISEESRKTGDRRWKIKSLGFNNKLQTINEKRRTFFPL
jgi:hypothetical protein